MNRLVTLLVAGVSSVAIASAAQAADLIIDEPVPSVGVIDTTGDWEGAFVGVFAGYGFGTADDEPAGFFAGDDLDVDGWLVGVDAGANFYVSDGVVFGIVGDIAWSDVDGETAADETFGIDWSGSLRGRIGFDGGAFMPYLTGGLAVAGVTDTDLDESNTYFGWTVGAGVEVAATDDLSIDLQYRYSDYGTQEFGAAPATEVSLTEHRVTAGLHWNF